jgi:hypothetical protein
MKIAVGVAIPAVMAAGAGLFVAGAARDLRGDVENVIEIDQPMAAASYEMEINAVGYGLGVLKYLQTGDVAGLERMANDRDDFARFLGAYRTHAV